MQLNLLAYNICVWKEKTKRADFERQVCYVRFSVETTEDNYYTKFFLCQWTTCSIFFLLFQSMSLYL